MTHKEKIIMLKETIIKLYEIEGRSKSYIANLLGVDRRVLTYQIKEWELKEAHVHRLTPSNQKFANKNRDLIKSRLSNNISQTKIAEELKVGRDYLRNIIDGDRDLRESNKIYLNKIKYNADKKKSEFKENSKLDYSYIHIEGELWKDILGYPLYQISNMGRVRKYIKTYNSYCMLRKNVNALSQREYIKIDNKGLQVSRLVGFAFVEGYSSDLNTIDHINGDVADNRAENLQWVAQATNNKLAYKNGKTISKSYSKNGKFKMIVLNDKYEFKTIAALAKFLKISETQTQRYISGETTNDYIIKFIY